MMRRNLSLMLWVALSWQGAKAEEDSAFLDRMVNSGTVRVSTYGDILKLAEATSGKKAEASPMLRRWMALDKKPNSWAAFDGTPIALRKYMNLLTFLSALDWRYDEARETFFFDFAWNRPSMQPAKKLLEIVLQTTPPPLDPRMRERMADDAWRMAFDGLLCKDEGAWMIRAEANASQPRCLSPGAVNFLCAGKIRDEQDRELAMVATHQPMQFSPGEGTVGFYLYDLEGNFVSGAVFSSGWRCSDVSGSILADGKTLRIVGWHNGTTSSSTEYVVRDGKLTCTASHPDRTAPATLSREMQSPGKTLAPFALSLSGSKGPDL